MGAGGLQQACAPSPRHGRSHLIVGKSGLRIASPEASAPGTLGLLRTGLRRSRNLGVCAFGVEAPDAVSFRGQGRCAEPNCFLSRAAPVGPVLVSSATRKARSPDAAEASHRVPGSATGGASEARATRTRPTARASFSPFARTRRPAPTGPARSVDGAVCSRTEAPDVSSSRSYSQ